MERLLLSLAIFYISTSVAQAQFTGCFTDPGCTTAVVGGPSSNAEDCCVNNNAGLYFNNGSHCLQCIVYGFGSDNFTSPEAQSLYQVPFAYFKGPSSAQLRVAIDYNGEGTASEEEFGIGQSVVSLPLNPGGTTSITFQADRVALEPDETFVLELTLLNVANGAREDFESSLQNVFFRSRQEFIIQDSTALVFRLRESDRVVDEGDREIPIEVTVANEVELASDISLVLTPMVTTEDFRPLPTTRPFALANTIEGRIDFFTTPITLNFTAGGPILLAGDVLIYDDLIDEALEYFVVNLTFQNPDNVPPLASIESNGGDVIRIDIIDNDDIFIGFALPNTTYPELNQFHQIQIIKGAGNVTEQTISFVVNLFQNAPPGLGTATPSAGGDDNDFSFPSSTLESIKPEDNDVFVDFTIFPDELPELTEAAQLRLSLPTEMDRMFPGFETLPQYPEFFIIIEDDDRFRIGFENTSYIVNEGIGMFQVCVVMFEPPEDTPLGTLTVSIGVETVQGTADGSDYTEVTGARGAFFLFFSDASRRSCFMVEITEDNRYELEEQFSLRFIELEGSNLPDNLVLDPAGSNITILDNTEVTVGFINPPYSAREDEGPMIFTVGVTGDHILERDIELSFSTVDGLIADFAAMAGLDYTSIINMPIILSAGMQSIDISVELNPDQIFENNEIFQGTLAIISGERVSLSPGTANATIVEDEIVCQELELLVNGRIEYLPDTTAPYLEGTIAEHICFPGFVLIGNVMRICQNDSTFSGVPPTCQPIECLPLGQVTNGMIIYAPDITSNYDLGTVATYTCNEGFRLDITQGGSETRTCIDDLNGDTVGVFTNLPPRCVLTLMTVNDTVSGDPLFSVPLNVPDKTLIMNVGENDPINLCFEVHGDDGGLFNLVSDACVSVNARYARVLPNEDINIVDTIYVRATDANGTCRNIEVSLDQCSASIDNVPVTDYMNAGITVRRFRNRVRIMVPNCADIDLVMWVSCLNTTFWSRESTDENEIIFHANNILFVIARGLNLAERSHGLLGQFWNVPIQVQPYTGPVRDGVNSDGYYVITTNHPNEPQRSFVGWLWPLTWEYKMEYCLYAGQRQAGARYEILDDTVNSPVIFGEYTDYIVDSPYATDFSYSHFEESRCAA